MRLTKTHNTSTNTHLRPAIRNWIHQYPHVIEAINVKIFVNEPTFLHQIDELTRPPLKFKVWVRFLGRPIRMHSCERPIIRFFERNTSAKMTQTSIVLFPYSVCW